MLTTLADLINGYPVRELAPGWQEAACRIAASTRAEGVEDAGTWDVFASGQNV